MAHHNSTPESVLKAPLPTVRYLVEHTGLPRRDRRHGQTSTGHVFSIRRPIRATNEPYRKPRKSA